MQCSSLIFGVADLQPALTLSKWGRFRKGRRGWTRSKATNLCHFALPFPAKSRSARHRLCFNRTADASAQNFCHFFFFYFKVETLTIVSTPGLLLAWLNVKKRIHCLVIRKGLSASSIADFNTIFNPLSLIQELLRKSLKLYLIGAVWCARCCCRCPQEACLWTRRSPGLGFRWRHTAWWPCGFFPPPSAGGPCQWWGNHGESGSLKIKKKQTNRLM